MENDNNKKKKFNAKEYYIKNKEKILAYNKIYFKQYYINKKKNKILDKKIEVKVEPFCCIIKKNVKVEF